MATRRRYRSSARATDRTSGRREAAPGRAMMASYTTDQFAFDFLVLPRTIVASATAIMAVAGLSQVPGIRALRALDIAETVRQQSA